MEILKVHLFGKPLVQRAAHDIDDLHSGKAQELFCFLLLNRGRPHTRESLATLLWPEAPSSVSRKYLRQAIWQLHLGLRGAGTESRERILAVEDHAVQLDPTLNVWLDVEIFERAWSACQGRASEDLNPEQAAALAEAAGLYRADLLEGWYFDWCICERERLQAIFLMTLDKLMGFSEITREYEKGLAYGELSLRYDRARERTYQRMMRLQCLAGDRGGGLRQFQRCAVALDEELGVRPSKQTLEVYEQIKSDRLCSSKRTAELSIDAPMTEEENPANIALSPGARLNHVRALLSALQQRVQKDLRAIDRVLRGKSFESVDLNSIESPEKQGHG
jgi:DNA-binding SARP family transcriptional activator